MIVKCESNMMVGFFCQPPKINGRCIDYMLADDS